MSVIIWIGTFVIFRLLTYWLVYSENEFIKLINWVIRTCLVYLLLLVSPSPLVCLIIYYVSEFICEYINSVSVTEILLKYIGIPRANSKKLNDFKVVNKWQKNWCLAAIFVNKYPLENTLFAEINFYSLQVIGKTFIASTECIAAVLLNFLYIISLAFLNL